MIKNDRYELDTMERSKIQYHLPKPGAYTNNGKAKWSKISENFSGGWGFNTLLKYNDIMFRKKGDQSWLSLSQVAGRASVLKSRKTYDKILRIRKYTDLDGNGHMRKIIHE